MKRIFAILLLMKAAWLAGQQDPHFSQYMFNGLIINPAFAGSKSAISGALFSRNQWTSLDGAPSYQSVSVHAPFSYNRIGLGGVILNESIFSEKFITVGLAGSYKINIRQGWMSFGLQGGVKQYHFAPNDLEIKDQGDIVLTGKQNSTNPDLAAGMFFQKKKYYLGISAQHLIPSTSSAVYKQNAHFYVIGAYRFSLSNSLVLLPSFLLKSVAGSTPQFDISTHLKYKENFWLGGSYRTSDAFALQGGVSLESIFPKLHQSMKIGYAYDFNTSKLSSVFGNSHEIMLIWDLRIPEKLSKIKNRVPSNSPLFF